MPTDQSTDSATATTRRRFITRAAVGGALVTAGAAASPIGGLLSPAGAQTPTPITAALGLSDDAFATFAIPLELAAVQAYQAALSGGSLGDDWTDVARSFQSQHQAVADTLVTLLDDEATAPGADTELVQTWSDSVSGGDENAVLSGLAEIEEILSATHLQAVDLLEQSFTAAIVSQVVSSEGQKAVSLAMAAGTPVAELTPPTAGTEKAIPISEVADDGASDESN